jgi:hypothetical protein
MIHDLQKRILFAVLGTIVFIFGSQGTQQYQVIASPLDDDALSIADLPSAEFLTEGDLSDDDGPIGHSEAIDRYINHPQTKEMIRYGKRHAGASRGLCLRGVKKAMFQGGKFFNSYPGVAWAVKFGPEMERVRFTDIYADAGYRSRIDENMENVPVGCIVLYKGVNLRADRNAKYGHIEIRTADGFVSDYFSARPRTGAWERTSGNNRQVTGVFCKIQSL